MKRLISVLLGISVLMTFMFFNASDINGQVKSTKLKPVRAVKFTGTPKIIMRRAKLESPEKMKVYKIKTMAVQTNLIQKLSDRHFLKVKPITVRKRMAPQVKLYRDKGKDFTRMIVNQKRGHIELLPNLKKLGAAKIRLLQKGSALSKARKYIGEMKLIPKDVSRFTAKKVVTLSSILVRGEKQKSALKMSRGRGGTPKLQSVLFQRTVNGKPVMGEGSQLVVNLGNNGNVEGFQRSLNHLGATNIKGKFRTGNEVYDRIAQVLKREIQGDVVVNVSKPRLVYYGNDRKYVQPAYFFTAKITNPKSKVESYYGGFVEALKNSPERIVTTPRIEKSALPKAPLRKIKGLKMKRKMSAAVPFDDPYVGRYVNRNDSKHWIADANDFKRGLIAGHCGGCPPITFPQYYWNYPRLFQSQDNYFVDRCHVVLMEGHGANWLFSTLKNCCDLVKLNSTAQPGYGGHAGGRMTFLILKSCSVVPGPLDRADWAKPWWRIFKGLRQAIGFRTTMYINDDISYRFGYYLARNCRVLDSWFYATNKSSKYQWQRFWGGSVPGYGAVVMIPGQEGAGIYHISRAPKATSTGLRIWYQH